MTSWDYMKALLREAAESDTKSSGSPMSADDKEALDGMCEFIDIACELHYKGIPPQEAVAEIKKRMADRWPD